MLSQQAFLRQCCCVRVNAITAIVSTSDNSEKTATHGLDSDSQTIYNDQPAGLDASKLLIDWLKTHAQFLQKTSQLVLADARLAATSGVQLAVLAIAFSLVFVCTWIVLNVGVALFLIWMGLSPAVSVGVIFLLHLAMLAAIAIAIRSTYQGLRFSASKDTLFSKEDQLQGNIHAKDSDNG